MPRPLAQGLLALLFAASVAEPARAATASSPEDPHASGDATTLSPSPGAPRPENRGERDPPPTPPVQGYVSRGIYSRFCFGLGVHIGVNALTAKKPLLGGVSAHFRASGIVGLTLEFDFNRVAEDPSPLELLKSAKNLHFIPNLRVAAVIVPYRWRMLGPFAFFGMGLDTATKSDRSTNIQAGIGLEGTFWRHRLAVVGEARFFMPLPADVERHRERIQIAGASTDTSSAAYYNLKNVLFTLSLRYYY